MFDRVCVCACTGTGVCRCRCLAESLHTYTLILLLLLVLAGEVPLWAVSPLVVFPPAVFGGCPPPVPLSRVAASSQSCVSCQTSLASPCLTGLPATNS